MKVSHLQNVPKILPLLLVLFLSACADQDIDQKSEALAQVDSRDLSCSYFYFLWGTHAEYDKDFEGAVDAYEKALICDPTASYIKHKLPLLHLKQGDTSKTIELLEKNVTDDFQDTASRKLLAGLLARQKKFDRAIDHYETILSYDPGNEQVLLRLGVLLEQSGKPQKAQKVLQKLIKVNPQNYFGYLALARMNSSPAEAQRNFAKALELNWSNELAYEIVRFHLAHAAYDQAIELLHQILDRDASQEQARLLIVQALLGLNREDEAIAELSLIPRYRSSPVQLSLVLSKLHVRQGNYPKAVEHLEAVLSKTNDGAARYLLGVIYSDQERFEKSLEVLQYIEADQQEFEDAVYLRAQILHQQGKSPLAQQMILDYMAQPLTRKPLFYIMASSLYRDSDKADKATEVLASGTYHFPENERLFFEYGLQLERTDQLEKAITVMEKLLSINPDHAEALNFVGYSWADTDQNLDQALTYIERAMELKPGNGYIQDSLGWVHFKLGNLELARAELLSALKLLPEDPYLHDHLGDIYRALEQNRKAIKSYKTALKYFEDEEKIEQIKEKIDALRNL